MLSLTRSLVLGSIALLVAAPLAVAQNAPPGTTRAPAERPSDTSQLGKYFAGKFMLCNQGVIEISQLAQQKASSSEVKQLANDLQQAHQELSQKLSRIAPEKANQVEQLARSSTTTQRPNPNVTPDRTNANPNRTGDPGSRGAGTGSPYDQLFEIDLAAASNHLQSSKKMLGQYQGQDFDMAFLGCQIGGHMWALAELKAIDQEASLSGEMQQIVKQATVTVEDHLEKAKQLAKRFEDDRKSASAEQ